MAKKPVTKKKEVKKKPVEITMSSKVQHIKIYRKYNPLRND